MFLQKNSKNKEQNQKPKFSQNFWSKNRQNLSKEGT
jgi:hypothetical protein